MSESKGYDSRVAANALLKAAWSSGCEVSNLKLQKLLYFAHGLMLTRSGRPLVNREFEAWSYGPVERVAYEAFSSWGRNPIESFAKGTNPVTGQTHEIGDEIGTKSLEVVNDVVGRFGGMTAGQLVKLSHASGAPWDIVIRDSVESANIGLTIPNGVIRSAFRHHWMRADVLKATEIDGEDTPFARHGYS